MHTHCFLEKLIKLHTSKKERKEMVYLKMHLFLYSYIVLDNRLLR